MDSLKSITLKDTVFLLANCWDNASLINKSWKNLHPGFLTDNDEPENDVPLAQLFNRLRGPNDLQISEAEAQEWAAGGAESELQRYEVLTDEEIVRAAMCKDDEQDEDNSVEVLASKKVGNLEAVGALNTALKWAEDNEFDSHEVMFFRRSAKIINRRPQILEDILVNALTTHFPYKVETTLISAQIKTINQLLQVLNPLEMRQSRREKPNQNHEHQVRPYNSRNRYQSETRGSRSNRHTINHVN
ncbi:hypothetical protein RN001_006599 [Aquatica leii]|uniref:Uncharacterized protein n=1 Tax=Aquatica leii TaxID=1421715 RepID=A0AAN7Q8Y8_9COLE|nr:hypothetical protein RN001_006599 [Aquatica leii]